MSGPDPEIPATVDATDAAGATPPYMPVVETRPRPVPLPNVGERFGDFEFTRILGQGGFGRVYLARQLSLERQVALKITPNRGSEARALAQLEHDHIVRVFSQSVDEGRGWRLVCMQFVPGTTLDHIIHRFKQNAGSGAAILAAIADASDDVVTLDPAALEDRERLAACDFIEAACWLGSRLAQALAYAHRRGILHRDIKPANILLNRYGRPLLVDFNLAPDPQKRGDSQSNVFGGTPDYMAPEHIDAYNPCEETTPEAVDARSDIFSLGVVLFELLSGQLPFNPNPPGDDFDERLLARAKERRDGPPSVRGIRPEVPEVLDRVLKRCLHPDPNLRYQTAEELAQALDGCRLMRRAEKAMPKAGPLSRAVLRRPFAIGLLLIFLPHLVGSAVNITYNMLRIITELTLEQQDAFAAVAMLYNLIVYPACVAIAATRVLPVVRTMRQLRHGTLVDRESVTAARRLALALPLWAGLLSALGWLPGGIIFPLVIHLWAGPLEWSVAAHLLISFTISGFIALTYSVLGIQYAVVRGLYLRLWSDGSGYAHEVGPELQPIDGRLQWLQILAGLIPLTSAVLMLGVGPSDQFTASYRILIIALIAIGMAGSAATMTVCARMKAAIDALRSVG